jgi:hypothetical protein
VVVVCGRQLVLQLSKWHDGWCGLQMLCFCQSSRVIGFVDGVWHVQVLCSCRARGAASKMSGGWCVGRGGVGETGFCVL